MQSPDLIVELLGAQPRPPEQLAALFAGGWPAFIDSDHVAGDALPRIRELFADWELAVLDPTTGRARRRRVGGSAAVGAARTLSCLPVIPTA